MCNYDSGSEADTSDSDCGVFVIKPDNEETEEETLSDTRVKTLRLGE
jgi:hypothetical protein